ncbi:MAG: acyltransferase [Ruminococcaceae bacterium]|nr:acyltransferase [Oscillospiraceae bacterium]
MKSFERKLIMLKAEKGRNVYLDLFRFLLAFMIVCIHLTDKEYDFYPLFRLSVPMFFMISGYFIYTTDQQKAEKKAGGFVRRSAMYMLIGIAFYTVYEFISCLRSGTSVGWFFTTVFYEGNSPFFKFFFLNAPIPYYTVGAQIWFLIALFVLSLVHFLLVKLGKTDLYKWLVPICFAIYFFFSGFMYIVQPHTDIPIRYMRNAWFFGLPTFGLGYLIAQWNWHKKSWYKYIYLALAIVFFLLQIPENELIARENSGLEMYMTGVLSAVFFLQFFLGIQKADCPLFYTWIGKSAPFYIYILHMGVACTLSRFITFPSPMVKSVVVYLASFFIYEIIFLLGKFLKQFAVKKI